MRKEKDRLVAEEKEDRGVTANGYSFEGMNML